MFESPRCDAAPSVSVSCTPKVVLHPVVWSRGSPAHRLNATQGTFVAELSILISSILATQPMMPHGVLPLKLATGWVFDGAATGVFKISVTLNCQIDQLSPERAVIARSFFAERPWLME